MNAAAGLTIATNNGDIGGGEVMLLQLATTAHGLGVPVRVAAPTTPGDVLDQARTAGIDVVPVSARGRPGYMRALRSWDRTRTGLMWCNGLVPALATAGHPRRVVHLHQPPVGLQRAARVVAVRGAEEVVVPSAYLGSLVPHTRVIPNWTADPGRATPRTPGSEAVIGFLGRLTLEKGVDVLAQALQALTREGRPVRLVLAGASRFGSARDAVVVEAALASLGDRVTRVGWVTPRELFDQVDLAVFPSDWPEPFGLVAAEAMAAGTPFVISDAGGLTEVAGRGHPWVARAGDVADLTATIARALDAPADVRAGVVESARARWESLFSPRAGRAHLAAVLADLGLLEAPVLKDRS